MRLFFLSTLPILFFACCIKQQDPPKHGKVEFKIIKINGAYLRNEEVEWVNNAISEASQEIAEIYEPADLLILCYVSVTRDSKASLFSFYDKDGLLYDGDWLDAQTEAMKGNKVQCWKLDSKSKELMQRLKHKYTSK